MPYLKSVNITFHTHDHKKNDSTVVHVFVKNRLNTSLSPEQNTDFISNWLAYQRYLDTGDLNDDERNPYLAYGKGLAVGDEFPDPSSRAYELVLRADTISSDEIVLPVVNIHVLTDDQDRWTFDYTITFTFDNAAAFTFSSNVAGITGITLDQHNRNYSGICIENPLHTLPAPVKPISNAVLKTVTLEFATHDAKKKSDTRLNVHIANRLSPSSTQDIAIGLDLFSGEEFPDAGPLSPLSYKRYTWSSDDGTLASNEIRLADMMLPEVYIIIAPSEDDCWIFDYRVTFEFSDPQNFEAKHQIFASRTSGIILDQDNNKYVGSYQGTPFPTVAPPTAPRLTGRPVDHVAQPKKIPVAFICQKLDEFINKRNGPDGGHNPPLNKIRLDNSGEFGPVPESYADRRSITAGRGTVDYFSSPTSIGQLPHDYYFNHVNSSSLCAKVDATSPTPLTFTINFDTSGSDEMVGPDNVDMTEFSISLRLTLDVARTVNQSGAERTVVDVMSWAGEIQDLLRTVQRESIAGSELYHYKGTFLKQPVDEVTPYPLPIGDLFIEQVIKVTLKAGFFDPGGTVRQNIRDQIFARLTTPDIISKKTPRDGFNSQVTSWLLGGVADDDRNTDGNNAVISSIRIEDDNIVISYMGPRRVFVPETPADWPGTSHDFSPGTLSNIDHIVVLTMENRSFDHMLGYLSLPPAKGGMGRSDVDGLKGGEANVYNGTEYPSFALTDTYFPMDPPHGYEPVHHAINGGRMDGFVQSFADAARQRARWPDHGPSHGGHGACLRCPGT